MAGKPLGERMSSLEALLVSHFEVCESHWRAVSDHLERLNGDVAENSKFRVQQKAIYGVIAVAWATIFVPAVTILVVVL